MNISAIRIFVRELTSAKEFYGDLIGLQITSHSSELGYSTFASRGVQLIVEVVGNDAPLDEQALVGRFSGVSFEVENIAAEHERLQRGGIVFSGPPERQGWGGWLATFKDPAGNELQLVQYPG
jgi:predicted enzyme related to lactoylglutathione lyase